MATPPSMVFAGVDLIEVLPRAAERKPGPPPGAERALDGRILDALASRAGRLGIDRQRLFDAALEELQLA